MIKILFHSFSMSDSDDPEIYAAGPLSEFLNTDKGKWIKENCADPMYSISNDPLSWGVKVTVYGNVEEKSATEYYLKWA